METNSYDSGKIEIGTGWYVRKPGEESGDLLDDVSPADVLRIVTAVRANPAAYGIGSMEITQPPQPQPELLPPNPESQL